MAVRLAAQTTATGFRIFWTTPVLGEMYICAVDMGDCLLIVTETLAHARTRMNK
jgi:hypothetical protein